MSTKPSKPKSTPADHMAGSGYSSTESHTGKVESGEGPDPQAWTKIAPAHAITGEPLVPEEVLLERDPITGRPKP